MRIKWNFWIMEILCALNVLKMKTKIKGEIKMKKAILILLCAIIMLTATGCSAEKNAATTTVVTTSSAPSPIALTKSNYSSYLCFDNNFNQTESTTVLGLPSKGGNLNFSVYSVVPGSFSNVSITVKLGLSKPWVFHDNPDSDNSYKTVTFRLPSNGQYDLTTRIGAIDRGSPFVYYTVESISGEFIPMS